MPQLKSRGPEAMKLLRPWHGWVCLEQLGGKRKGRMLDAGEQISKLEAEDVSSQAAGLDERWGLKPGRPIKQPSWGGGGEVEVPASGASQGTLPPCGRTPG